MPEITEREVKDFQRNGYVRIDLADIAGQEAFAKLRLAYLEADRRNFEFDTASWNNPATAAVFRYTGLRHHYPDIAAFVTSPALGKAAAMLMGVDHVRLLEEEALVKPPGGKETHGIRICLTCRSTGVIFSRCGSRSTMSIPT